MAQVLAVLQAASSATETKDVTAPVTVTPAPTSLIDLPTVSTWLDSTDLPNARMKFGYLAYQTYNSSIGQRIASVNGTTDWVSIPGVSKDFPDIEVISSVDSSLAGSTITFAIEGIVNYTKVTPGLYNVTYEE